MSEVNVGPYVIDEIQKKIVAKEYFFSVEYYPPKTKKTIVELKQAIPKMISWGPAFCDITWGAGGVTSELTPEIANYIQNNETLKGNCNMHLTCTNMPKEKVDIALEAAKKMGVRNILALRGDPPRGAKEWKAIDTGFSCALDLINYIKKKYNDYFCITCAGYPEGHPLVRKKIDESKWNKVENEPKYWAPWYNEKEKQWEGVSPTDWKKELAYLKSKVDAGASAIVTQLFYDETVFIDFVKECRKIGIKCPILPGIMPIANYGLFYRMCGFCKTVIPDSLKQKMEELKDDNEKIFQFGIKYVTNMCNKILNAGNFFGIHIYCMNQERAAINIIKNVPKLYNKTNDFRKMVNKEFLRVEYEHEIRNAVNSNPALKLISELVKTIQNASKST